MPYGEIHIELSKLLFALKIFLSFYLFFCATFPFFVNFFFVLSLLLYPFLCLSLLLTRVRFFFLHSTQLVASRRMGQCFNIGKFI